MIAVVKYHLNTHELYRSFRSYLQRRCTVSSDIFSRWAIEGLKYRMEDWLFSIGISNNKECIHILMNDFMQLGYIYIDKKHIGSKWIYLFIDI